MDQGYLQSSLLLISISSVSSIIKELIETAMEQENISLVYTEDIFDWVVTHATIKIGEEYNYEKINIFSAEGFDISALIYDIVEHDVLTYLTPVITPYFTYFRVNGKLKTLITYNEIALSKTKYRD